MPVPNAKPLNYQGIKPKKPTGKLKKSLRWRDENGMDTLVDIKFIDANNKGMKCGPGNKVMMLNVTYFLGKLATLLAKYGHFFRNFLTSCKGGNPETLLIKLI